MVMEASQMQRAIVAIESRSDLRREAIPMVLHYRPLRILAWE